MSRVRPSSRVSWFDAVILIASLAAAGWVGTRSTRDMAISLGLAIFEIPDWGNQGTVKPLRERYAEAHPNSPLTWINRQPWVRKLELQTARFRAAILPSLIVVTPGLGLIVIRRQKPGRRRSRVGPGWVAGAVGLSAASLGLANEFIMRRFNLQSRGDLHYDLEGGWILISEAISIAIFGAWILLLLSGRFRGGRGWREWVGRALGFAWLATLLWEMVLQPLSQIDGLGN